MPATLEQWQFLVTLLTLAAGVMLAIDRWVHRRRAEEVKLGSDTLQLVKDLADLKATVGRLSACVDTIDEWKIAHAAEAKIETDWLKRDIRLAYRRIEALERRHTHRRAGDDGQDESDAG